MTVIFSTRNKENSINEDAGKNIIFSSNEAPEAIWPYSKAYKAWDLLFCSWQIWLDSELMEIVKWGIVNEARQVCRNIAWLLEEYNLSLKNVVKTTIFIKNIKDFDKVNEVYKNYFILKPARSTVEVSALPKGALIEIEVIAQIKK